jgi:hypothetical protein
MQKRTHPDAQYINRSTWWRVIQKIVIFTTGLPQGHHRAYRQIFNNFFFVLSLSTFWTWAHAGCKMAPTQLLNIQIGAHDAELLKK